MQLFNNIQSELITQIEKSTKSIKIAVTWFTNHELYSSLLKKLENPNFNLDIIVLNDRINNKLEGVNFQELINQNANFYYSENENMVHHKFCVIDDKIVITGSYNWTYYAENRNWENIVIISDEDIVKGFISEYDKIKDSHKKITDVKSSRKLGNAINSTDYLTTDYSFQAEVEEKKGNDIAVAKIYTEILKLDNKKSPVKEARTKIINKINSQTFETCPFEIGIQFQNGYSKVIPAFTPLPITIKRKGSTPINNAKSLQTTIQKYDFRYRTILQFSLDNIKPCPINTEKIEYTLTVDKKGILTISCIELNGYNRRKTLRVELKNWL